jgi:hypothetical protein
VIHILTTILIAIGVQMAPPHTPEGNDALTAQMVALYDAAMDDINKLAGRAVLELAENPERRASQFREIRAAQMTRAIQEKLARLEGQTRLMVESPLRDQINAAIERGTNELRELGIPTDPATQGVGVGFGLVNSEAVEVIARDTLSKAVQSIETDLGNAARQHATNAVELFRSLSSSSIVDGDRAAGEASVNRAIARGLITGNPTIADRAIRELFADSSEEAKRVRKLGNKQIQVGKATMSVRHYASTVARTRTREATVTARHGRLLERGVNLVQITGKNSSNFCTAFIGLVCSIGPAPEIPGLEVVELASLPGGGPPFHPNCSKGTAPYLHELVSKARQADARRALAVYTKRRDRGQLLDSIKR